MTKRVVVTGRVQGVGFRAYTQDQADRYGVIGEVWNRRDGGVEMIASHEDPAALDAFVESLNQGPGYVQGIQVTPATDQDFAGFTVGPTR